MDPLVWIEAKFGVTRHARAPIELPNCNRESLARWFGLWGFTVGAEIGVERGHYSEALLRENPLLELLCVDAWKAYRGYRDHVDQQKLDRFFAETQERLGRFQGRASILRGFSIDRAKDIENGSLDFVYIDGNHRLEAVIADLVAWSPKVRPGGVIAGHDYIRCKLPSLMHVPQAIHAWMDAYELAPLFVVGRHAKVEGELRDDGRSWFYVQPEPRTYRHKGHIQQ